MFDAYLAARRQLRQVWMHRRAAAVVTILVAASGWLYVSQQNDVYLADTRLYVDKASMLNRLLAGVALDSTDVDQEFLRVARSSLLSRPNLERIAEKIDLGIAAATPAERERMLNELGSRIIVEADSTRHRGQENLFQLAFEHGDPERALQVVRAVHDVFIDSVLGLSQRDAEKMDGFLDRQIAHYETRLEEAEERRKRFRQNNSGLLPGEGQNYFTILHTARERLRAAELDLTRAERVRDNLLQQIEAIPGGMSGLAVSPQEYDQLASTNNANQLRELEAQLHELRGRFTDQHPDVRQAQRRLEQLRADMAFAGQFPDADNADGGQTPADRFRLQDLRADLARAEATVASERATVEEYQSRMAELEGAVHTIPEVEAEMTRLDRDYDIVRRQYEELVSRRESARMSRDADLSAEDGVFRVIDPPHVTSRPIAPDRPLLLSLVLGAAFAAGSSVALGLALVQPTYADVGQLRERTGVHVIGRIGTVRSRRETLSRAATYSSYGLLLAALLASYLFLLWRFA